MWGVYLILIAIHDVFSIIEAGYWVIKLGSRESAHPVWRNTAQDGVRGLRLGVHPGTPFLHTWPLVAVGLVQGRRHRQGKSGRLAFGTSRSNCFLFGFGPRSEQHWPRSCDVGGVLLGPLTKGRRGHRAPPFTLASRFSSSAFKDV